MERTWPRVLLAGLAVWGLGCADKSDGARPGSPGRDAGACVDRDQDGYGRGCAESDCDDRDPDVHEGCKRCALPNDGCPCEEGAQPVTCYLDKTEADDGTTMCHEGTRYCRDGSWSSCEGVHSYPLPEERQSQTSIIDPDAGPVQCNDCSVTCFRITDTLDPVDGGLDGSAEGIDWVAGGGLTLGRQPLDAGGPNLDAGTFYPPTGCMPGTAPDVDCDGIPDEFDEDPDDPPFATASPGIFLDIGPGQTGTGVIDLGFFINSADVYFLVDQSASMTEERDNLKADLTAGDFIDDDDFHCSDANLNRIADDDGLKDQGIIGAIKCMIRDASFGVGFHREIPFPNYADNKQIVFDNYQDITSNTADVLAAVNRLDTVGNQEWPEASMLALHNLVTGSGMYFGIDKRGVPPRNDCPATSWGYPCFRESAIPIVVLFTDAMMHNGPSNNAYPYNANYLKTKVGTTQQYLPLPPTNENFIAVHPAGDLTNQLLTFTGDTTGMDADIAASMLSCLSNGSGPDAVVEFQITQPRTVTLSTEGSRFDTVLGLFTGQPQPPVMLPDADGNNETAASAIELGEVSAAGFIIEGSSAGMDADYDWSAVQCSAEASTPDAVFSFELSSTTLVDISTDGSALDTVVALYDAPPITAPTYTASGNGNDSLESALLMGDVDDTVRAYSGNSIGLDSDFTGAEVGCGADNNSPDAVYGFSLLQPTRVRISTEGSAFDTVIALVGDSCVSEAPMPPSGGSSPGSQATSNADYTFATGAVVIPMDTSQQDTGMIHAYGLIYELLRENIPVSWVIQKNKSPGGIDMTAAVADYDTEASLGSISYRGGPFVIDAADVAAAVPFIDGFRLAFPNVEVHVTTEDVTTFVRRQLVAAPRFALMLDGGQTVARAYLQAAALGESGHSVNWPDASPDTLTVAEIAGTGAAGDGALFDTEGAPKFCGVISTGWPIADARTAAGEDAIEELRTLLETRSSLFAQGESVMAIENSVAGLFLTRAGYVAGTRPSALSENVSDLSFVQLDGAFSSEDGAFPSFTLPALDDYKDNDSVFLTEEGSPSGQNDVFITGHLDGECSILADSCEAGLAPGTVSYLGGDQYTTTTPITTNVATNGARLFLNAFFSAECALESQRPDPTILLTGLSATTDPQVTYDIAYENAGAGHALDTQIVYTLPSGASFVSATDGGSLGTGQVVWNLATLAPGESGTVHVTVSYGDYGAYANQASIVYAQGLTERTVDSWVITTTYTSSTDLDCTALGISEENVPATNEYQGVAYDTGLINGRVFVMTGSTTGMDADYDGSDLGCGADDAAPDAAFHFSLEQDANVTISTEGTDFDSVIALFDGTVSAAEEIPSTNMGETTENAQAIGNVNGKRLLVTGANTTLNAADYRATEIDCSSADPSDSGEAVYRFTLTEDTSVRLSTAGSSFDTMLSLHDDPIEVGTEPIEITPPIDNENVATAYTIPVSVDDNDITIYGNSRYMNYDMKLPSSCYEGQSYEENSKDAVIKFNVATPGLYDIDTRSSSFDTVLAIYPEPPKFTDIYSSFTGDDNESLSTAFAAGLVDDSLARAHGSTSNTTNSWSATNCSAYAAERDAFITFTLASPQTVTIDTLSNTNFNTVLLLYRVNSNGTTTFQNCNDDASGSTTRSRIQNESLGAGTWLVVVTGDNSGDRGSYELRISDSSPTSNLLACDNEISLGWWGLFGNNNSELLNLNLSAGNYYAIVKGEEDDDYGSYQLHIRSHDFNGGVSDANQVACNDTFASTQQSEIVADLTMGTYYAVVKGHSGTDEGGYQLLVEDVDSPPIGAQVACNDDGGPDNTSLIEMPLDAGDYWVVLKGDAAGDAGNYRVLVEDQNAAVGTIIECNNDGGINGSSVIERDLDPGDYFVIVKGDEVGDSGNYKLSVRDVSGSGHAPIACDADSGAGTASHIQQSLDPGTYYLVVKGDDVGDAGDYRLTVQDANNSPLGAIACNDDGGSYETSKISRTLNPGTYYAAVKGYNASQAGRYQLTIGGTSAANGTYVPPTWAQTLSALNQRDVRVLPILSCMDDPEHGNADGDCNSTRSQAISLANATDALGENLEPLVFDIKRNGDGLSRSVVDGIASLAEYLEMDVQVVVDFYPDANPGFNVTITAIEDAFDDCDGLIANEHQNCRPGATPRFHIAFENPLPGIPLNEDDPGGGYTFRAQLIGDGQFIVDEIPIYIVPEQLEEMGPPVPPYYQEGSYWQDTGSPGCEDVNQAPDWRDLSWDADVPTNAKIRFLACTAPTRELLDTCTPHEIASVTGVGTCASDTDCDLGYCDPEVGACQVAQTGTCTDDSQCGVNSFCDVAGSMQCVYESQPVYIGASLGSQNLQSFLRMTIAMSVTDVNGEAPVLHQWEMTYLCQNAL